MTRRTFVSATAAGALTSLGLRAEAADATDAWSFILLGDIHYDRPEHHDMAWLREKYPNDVRQVEDYCRVSEQFTPRLLEEVRQQIADSPVPVRYVIHVGDFVEGLCGSADLAAHQCRDAVQLVRGARLGAPFLITKGNHDITGPGAAEAYDSLVLPFLDEQMRREDALTSASFTLRHGECLFAFLDAYDRHNLDWLERALVEAEARRVFIVVHPPLVPYNARANWHLFARTTQADQRRRLIDLMGKTRAIVLCGHLHRYGTVGRRTDHGSFAQFAVSSIIRADLETPSNIRAGLADYGPNLVELEPRFSPTSVEQRRRLLEAEAASIGYFDYANVPGYAIVTVRGKAVDADVYTGLGKRLWKSVDLAALTVG